MLFCSGTGCAEYALDKTDVAAGAATPSDTGFASTTAEDTVSTAPAEALWYVLSASLRVVDGNGGAAIAAAVDVINDDLSIACTVGIDPLGVVAEDELGVDIVWWTATVDDSASTVPLPDTMRLGLGALSADVLAQLGSRGLDAVADSLFGAYTEVDGEVVTFGYAGTTNDLSGDDPAALPIPDGLYEVHPVFLLPLP